MLPAQQRFWPDPQPLVERMGQDFFRQLPESPGIYMMRGAEDSILYVGKAKNLRNRLGSYRRACPERLSRRIVRLLHLVQNIHWEICVDEPSSLAREAELLLQLRPRFNRAGVWKGRENFLVWRGVASGLEIAVAGAVEEGWNGFGSLDGVAIYLHRALVRLLWNQMNPEKGIAGMPPGWFAGSHSQRMLLAHGKWEVIAEAADRLSELARGNIEIFSNWIAPPDSLFEQQCLAEDLADVSEWIGKRRDRMGLDANDDSRHSAGKMRSDPSISIRNFGEQLI
ncbi:MAG: nucleotide excision repair endonuclease [Verrucomicrobiota bacterium]